MDSVK